MNNDISLAAAIIITVFLILGSGLTLIGAIGLVRFSNFYERLHVPSVGMTWGAGSILISSFLYSMFIDHRFIFHEILLMIFVLVTAPVTSMLLSQAAAYRHYVENQLKKPLALLSHRVEDKLPIPEQTSHDESQCGF
ncbi:monovalent cation/H(+) antiporter subunit G [Bartonella sp. CB189]|uniref:monovalent cation/H(+) antiporter subunit G n=1 Tax=Bartonella sp. CB189 TaxID=3112254 RepID=UPI002F968B1D